MEKKAYYILRDIKFDIFMRYTLLINLAKSFISLLTCFHWIIQNQKAVDFSLMFLNFCFRRALFA